MLDNGRQNAAEEVDDRVDEHGVEDLSGFQIHEGEERAKQGGVEELFDVLMEEPECQT